MRPLSGSLRVSRRCARHRWCPRPPGPQASRNPPRPLRLPLLPSSRPRTRHHLEDYREAAPELTDLSGESKATLEAYGVDREDLDLKAARGGGPGQYKTFGRNCLLARRMVERGVRFINIIHASWDHHSGLENGLRFNAGMSDQPIAALPLHQTIKSRHR